MLLTQTIAFSVVRGLAEAPPSHDDVSGNRGVPSTMHVVVRMQGPLHLRLRASMMPLQNSLVRIRNMRDRVGKVAALVAVVHMPVPWARVYVSLFFGGKRLHKRTPNHVELGQRQPLAENPLQGPVVGSGQTFPHVFEKFGCGKHRKLGHELNRRFATKKLGTGFGPWSFHTIPIKEVRAISGGKQDFRSRHWIVEDSVTVKLKNVISPGSVVVSPKVYHLSSILPEPEKPLRWGIVAELVRRGKGMDLQSAHVGWQQRLQK
mmetsp:Transcript_2662/g.4750  ORF Transcript_2662/g.4750 Transcript_2662/m.4750 type:complete len:262 (-) Transcript_2662:412-1197(-)